MNFMMHAFELAQNLELELPNMTNNPEILFSSIHEVEKAYSDAKERVMMMLSSSSSQHDKTTTKGSGSFAQILSHDVFMQKNQHDQIMHAQSMDHLLLIQHPFEVSALLENKMISGSGDAQLLRSKGSQLGEAPPSRPKKRYLFILFCLKLNSYEKLISEKRRSVSILVSDTDIDIYYYV